MVLLPVLLHLYELAKMKLLNFFNEQTGKTPEEIRKTFNIKNDFTPEEEEQVGFKFVC